MNRGGQAHANTPGTDERIIPLLRDGQPDWEAIHFEILCPRCGYNLRMLPMPRCPECGLGFNWPDLLMQTLSRLTARQRASTFVRNVGRSLRPIHFWRGLRIEEPFGVAPLLLLLAASVGSFTILLKVSGGMAGSPLWSKAGAFARSNAAALHFVIVVCYRDPLYRWAGLLLGLGLLASLALLCGLRQTLGRCRVQSKQVLRVLAFASVPLCLYSAVLEIVGLNFCSSFFLSSPPSPPWLGWFVASLIMLGPPALLAVFLRSALRHYLKLPQAAALATTAAGVGFLFSYTAVLLMVTWRM